MPRLPSLPFSGLIPILVLLLVTPILCEAQEEARERKNVIAITPLKLVVFTHLGPEFTYQRKLKSRLSLQTKAAWIYSYASGPIGREPFRISNGGGKLGLEVKYFPLGSFEKGLYLAAEIDAAYHSYPGSLSYQVSSRQTDSDRFDVVLKYGGPSIKLGYQKVRGFFFYEFYAGIGIRHVDVQYEGITSVGYSNLIRDEGLGKSDPARLFLPYPSVEGTSRSIAIPLNVRIGIAF